MFELIRANKRNSIILMMLMAMVMLALGYVIGIAFGLKKVQAIKAAIGNIINILITDEKTAEALIE